MNHPTREDWMEYLYGETPADLRSARAEHLRECAECRAQLDAWQQTKRALDSWETGVRPLRTRTVFSGAVRWAAAACLAVALGFVGARLATPELIDAEAMRADIARDVRAALKAELREELGSEWHASLVAAQDQIYTGLYAAMRRDLAATAANLSVETRTEMLRWLGQFAYEYEEDRTLNRGTLAEWLAMRDRQHARELAIMQHDIIGLANLAGAEFERTHQRINSLARYAPAE